MLYTELFRGTPVLITLMFIYFGVAYFGYEINLFAAGILGLSIYQGAYIAEVFRAGIEAVPKGQWEVSWILGLSKRQTFLSVVLPQTRGIVLPPLVGQYLSLIKDTSIVSMIGMSELMHRGRRLSIASASQWWFTAGRPALLRCLLSAFPLGSTSSNREPVIMSKSAITLSRIANPLAQPGKEISWTCRRAKCWC